MLGAPSTAFVASGPNPLLKKAGALLKLPPLLPNAGASLKPERPSNPTAAASVATATAPSLKLAPTPLPLKAGASLKLAPKLPVSPAGSKLVEKRLLSCDDSLCSPAPDLPAASKLAPKPSPKLAMTPASPSAGELKLAANLAGVSKLAPKPVVALASG